MKSVAMTPEKLVGDFMNTINGLKAEIERLGAQRKDLKRFMDVDKEKEELEFLRAEKHKLLATASKEADAIKAAARKSADRVMENGNENARIEFEKARKITENNDRRSKELTEQAQVMLNKNEALSRLEVQAVEREKRLLLREGRIGDFVERMKEAL